MNNTLLNGLVIDAFASRQLLTDDEMKQFFAEIFKVNGLTGLLKYIRGFGSIHQEGYEKKENENFFLELLSQLQRVLNCKLETESINLINNYLILNQIYTSSIENKEAIYDNFLKIAINLEIESTPWKIYMYYLINLLLLDCYLVDYVQNKEKCKILLKRLKTYEAAANSYAEKEGLSL